MQNVGTPRFYINDFLYSHSLGITELDALIDGNPSNPYIVSSIADGATNNNYYFPIDYDRPNYCALLGHNLASKNIGFRRYNRLEPPYTGGAWNGGHGQSPIVNSVNGAFIEADLNSHSGFTYPEYDGFTIFEITNASDDDYYGHVSLQFGNSFGNGSQTDIKMGTIMMGKYYDMPHSPDLNLKLSYEYDGVKTIQAKNGATLSNAMYTKPADWGDSGAWQLGGEPNYRTGRRTWDLSFSYLSDESTMPYLGIQNYEDDGTGTGTIVTTEDILTGSDFMSVVWNKTLGNALPFIFNPNGGGESPNNSPDQFAICKFVGDTLKYKQVAPNTYNIKLKIEEVW